VETFHTSQGKNHKKRRTPSSCPENLVEQKKKKKSRPWGQKGRGPVPKGVGEGKKGVRNLVRKSGRRTSGGRVRPHGGEDGEKRRIQRKTFRPGNFGGKRERRACAVAFKKEEKGGKKAGKKEDGVVFPPGRF